jgi:hypothetical protein
MKTGAMIAAGVLAAATAACDPRAIHEHLAGAHLDAQGGAPHGGATAQGASQTHDLQGGYNEWRASPFIQQYYDLTKGAFADGADKVDFADYQEKSYAIFRAFGAASGGGKAGEEAMLDHLKDIPRQMVGIVKDDPGVLESYDAFWIALSGPP